MSRSTLSPEEQAVVAARITELRQTHGPLSASNQAYVEAWRRRNRTKIRTYQLQHLYGLSWADYQAILIAQENRCAICRHTLSPNRWPCVDHCHISNQVRGILCSNCNTKAGWLVKHISNITAYLNPTRLPLTINHVQPTARQ